MTAPAFDRELQYSNRKVCKYFSPTRNHELRLANAGRKIRRSWRGAKGMRWGYQPDNVSCGPAAYGTSLRAKEGRSNWGKVLYISNVKHCEITARDELLSCPGSPLSMTDVASITRRPAVFFQSRFPSPRPLSWTPTSREGPFCEYC